MLMGLVVLAPSVALLVAQAAGGTGLGEPWDSLIKLGITPMVFIALLGMRKIRWQGEVEEIKASYEDRLTECRRERDEAKAETKEVRTWFQTQALPLFTQTTEVVKETLKISGR